ncbi:MAG: nitroreductase family protein [Acidimicrobiia bacterium]
MSGVPEWIARRRSIRSFAPDPVDEAVLETCVEAALLAPAPHHSRPWRHVVLGGSARRRLADAMADAWLEDLRRDGIGEDEATRLCETSVQRIASAPAAVLGCLVWDGLDDYPDVRRRDAEWAMALLSLGASVQNLMLAAAEYRIASCWIAAPVFCPDAAAASLALDSGTRPAALVLLGHPDPAYSPPVRPPAPMGSHRLRR